MAKCPLCNAPIADDFGLIECGHCQSPLIVHMDGRVEFSGAKEAPLSEDTQAAHSEDLDDPKTHFAFPDPELVFEVPARKPVGPPKISIPPPAVPAPTAHDAEALEPTILRPSPSPAPASEPPADIFEDSLFGASMPAPEPIPEVHELTPTDQFAVDFQKPAAPKSISLAPPPVEAELPPDPFQQSIEAAYTEPLEALAPEPEAPLPSPAPSVDDFAAEMGEPPTEVYRPPGAGAEGGGTNDLSDIAGFGNSEASSTRDGSLRYNIFVSGIDTVDMRVEFREAITDRKLIWDTDAILRSIKNGEVNISNVPAAKAYILISRMRSLPFQVRWEQYAISQS